MSIAIRNFEEKDVPGARDLLAKHAGPELAASAHLLMETFKPCSLLETTFGLVAEESDQIHGTAAILMEQESAETVIGMLCRLCVTDSPERPAIAANLVATALQSLGDNLQLCFSEIPSNDLWAQAVCEQSGFVPCGFLPEKFHGESRSCAVVYTLITDTARNARRPHPEIIPGAQDLATEVLKSLGMMDDIEAREDIVAYPTEGNFILAPIDADAVATMLQSQTHHDCETFPILHRTQTRLHFPTVSVTYLAAKDGDRVIGVIGYFLDVFDKRVQITDVIALDGEPEGFMVAGLLEKLAVESSPEYWEVLVSAHSPRMQKTFDQLGFVPCAYLPAFGMEHGQRSDAIKMVKLSEGYESEGAEFTSATRKIFDIVDNIFREHSVGPAVLKLLRDLRVFRGLGEGELRRVARLFSQKLFKPGEVVVEEGSKGQELYVVERGEIEITNKDGSVLYGSIKNGGVLGEIAFLNGEPRTARAASKSATIVRIIRREDFDRLIQREMHLGLIFFQNIALDLADKLRVNTQGKKS